METLRCAGTFSIQIHDVCGVLVRETRHERDIECISLPAHAVMLAHDPREWRPCWNGERLPWVMRPRGAITFLPRGTVFSADVVPGRYRGTLIALEHSLFERVAADHVDLAAVPLRFADATTPLTAGLCETIRLFTVDDDVRRWPLMVESASITLAAAIIRAMSPRAAVAFSRLRSPLAADRRRRVTDYIEANLHRPLSIAEMAGVASLSPFHFTRAFRAAVGETPLRYVSRRRIEEAQRLLATTSLPICEVALATGYSSQSHMSTVFRKLAKTTPGAYRRSAVAR